MEATGLKSEGRRQKTERTPKAELRLLETLLVMRAERQTSIRLVGVLAFPV
jgi:hypothetical protein